MFAIQLVKTYSPRSQAACCLVHRRVLRVKRRVGMRTWALPASKDGIADLGVVQQDVG